MWTKLTGICFCQHVTITGLEDIVTRTLNTSDVSGEETSSKSHVKWLQCNFWGGDSSGCPIDNNGHWETCTGIIETRALLLSLSACTFCGSEESRVPIYCWVNKEIYWKIPYTLCPLNPVPLGPLVSGLTQSATAMPGDSCSRLESQYRLWCIKSCMGLQPAEAL